MTEHQTLGSFLAEFGARDEMAAAIARTVKSIADSCCAIEEVIAANLDISRFRRDASLSCDLTNATNSYGSVGRTVSL